MSYSNHPSIRFPPGTITSKLSSKMLRQPPCSKDWMHQTYMQMIQDVSYVTSHYYESPENGTSLLGANKAISNSKPSRLLYETSCHSAIVESSRLNRPIKNSSPLSQFEFHNDSDNSERYSSDEEAMNDDDDEVDLCYTATTSSTDCNRKNNVYRLYKEQQGLQKPFDEELETTIPIVQRSNSCRIAECNVTYLSSSSGDSSGVTQDTKAKKNKQQPNKKFTKLKRMMTKMRMAAENPFWAIDSRF
ncbi:hypothetical protein EDC94DRAFT_654005 [Helicostylum pulchrum]|uniref:Uncharacterized protein n=1 Tax=Helicostylum pulchrum TaxID=562976 RepID=A0ABP9Y036_9FUNG|nr:hypothetical protein EDC94DRAFT_654005 [Helicostylum pulchrum]